MTSTAKLILMIRKNKNCGYEDIDEFTLEKISEAIEYRDRVRRFNPRSNVELFRQIVTLTKMNDETLSYMQTPEYKTALEEE